MAEDEEVYADGFIKVPAKRWYHIADALTRQDELMEAVLKVLGAINEKLPTIVAPPPPLVVRPPPPPAPPEWTPLTDRFDIITNHFRDYLSRIRALPVTRVGRYPTPPAPGTDTTPQTLASWNVGRVWSKRYGMLNEVSMVSNNFPNTRFRLRVEMGAPTEQKVILFDNMEIQAALTLPFSENRLPYDTWVYLDCWSTGPAIIVDGSIMGVEWSY